ncbi:uncharacterized protein LOC117504768 [Thalassophryne amazonica]|uniref:uncharacterized protein LOC117504768 n=1 Tax=Thalassophryne amazonica TaxID=390379 RepID=UPI001471564F|nr:uncharacterized protein LOC117504768 [Thalassophryne amazonica]
MYRLNRRGPKIDPWGAPQWSKLVTLTVSDADKPKAVLTVSPSWLSPGAPVTLHCEVKDPEAGWRFYWFQAVPKLPENAYSYELLRGSSSGTEQDSYIVHRLKHTVGFMCRAGRGDPEFLTNDSQPKFVWSGDFPSPVSLTVVPNRVQHFTSQSLSLHCEGNSEWTVKKFTQSHQASLCDSRKRSRCEFTTTGEAVYWCETAAGQFSNAINITAHPDIILLSPAHPVTEGDSVTLGCELTTQTLLSNTDFYRNDRIIRNNTNGTMTFAAYPRICGNN